ncbi:M23 family metallopeptidase [Rhodococcus jostii]|uniref:Peptidase family M23 n=1 Tax=Rhodococcus jostii TaxID=132919 RepID=A0A1H4TGD0_RHOJO|nr:M23 family metallopeptidase [Rhodococcus jostii]SEC55174.1 Peptidase family M23 [Rhodococcus jostii]
MTKFGAILRALTATATASTLLAAAALLAPPADTAPTGDFDWPLHRRPRVVRPFDNPEHDWLPGHRGVDLGGVPDEAVLSAGAGVVVFAGTVAGKPVVSVDHPGGLRTTYEPVTARVTPGLRVGRGTVLGTLEAGHPGCISPVAACLRWGLRRDREYLDPLGLLRVAPVRLEPVERRGSGG